MAFDVERLSKLRAQMKQDGLVAYLITTGDPHDSEEPAPFFAAERRYFCPFTGDNAFVLVTMDGAYLWTDGRFFISAEQELEGSTYQLMKMSTPGYPSLSDFLKAKNLYPLGLDESVVSPSFLGSISHGPIKDINYRSLVENMPPFPNGKIWKFDGPEYHDLTAGEKIESVKAKVKAAGAKAHLITTLDDIAYLTNLRGNDIECTPLFYSYLYIDIDENPYLFVNEDSIGFDYPPFNILPYASLPSFLKERADVPTLIDEDKANAEVATILHNRIDGKMPSRLMKAVKGPKEIENIKSIQEEDGVALLKLIAYLDEHKGEKLTEWDIVEVLHGFRAEGKRFFEESFTTIAAAGPNAAMMHYAPTAKSFSEVDPSSCQQLLVDSGGQYYGGTTDTTRTFPIGKLCAEYIRDYTLTLKSVISLSDCVFLQGSTGRPIDMMARYIMWQEGMDYKCGTGHGVGYVSVVHESPNGFRYRQAPGKDDDAVNVPGMVTTIEPGVYKKDKWGIRIENNLLTVPAFETEDGVFYKFETITYVPIDLEAVDVSLLTDREIAWINAYHQEVYRRLSKLVSGKLLEVLEKKTRPLSR
ncbi:MAG: M24 family metallopeptidase [Bacilli bacterium]|nr:M24 family metallopeptidase [Bacilli bacterium]